MNEPTLESLRAEGAERVDPVRFRYLETLAARLPTQPPSVQRVLETRLRTAVLDYAARVPAQPVQAPAALAQAGPAAASPLALLNRDLQHRARAHGGDERALLNDSASPPALPSVQRFGEVWAKIAAEQRVDEAFSRGPENAGPLNPHRLLLRSLALMRNLSPDYLRHFVSQMDTLLWLEQASARPARPPLRPGRARSKG